MNRRGFLRALGLGAVAAVVAPKLLVPGEEEFEQAARRYWPGWTAPAKQLEAYQGIRVAHPRAVRRLVGMQVQNYGEKPARLDVYIGNALMMRQHLAPGVSYVHTPMTPVFGPVRLVWDASGSSAVYSQVAYREPDGSYTIDYTTGVISYG